MAHDHTNTGEERFAEHAAAKACRRSEASWQTSPLARELWQAMFRGNMLFATAGVLLALARGVNELAFSYVLMPVFNAMATGSLEQLIGAAIFAALIMAVDLVFGLAERWVCPNFMRRAVVQYREAAFGKLLDKGIGAFDAGGASAYESALTNDATTIETSYLQKLFDLPRDVLWLVGSVVMLLWVNVPLALVAIACAVVPLCIGVASGERLAACQHEVSDQTSFFVACVHDLVGGFPLIKSFRAEKPTSGRFVAQNAQLEDAKCSSRKTERSIALVSSTFQGLAQLVVLFFGAWLCIAGKGVSVGAVIMATNLMNYIALPFKELPGTLAARRASHELVNKLAAMLEQNQQRAGGEELALHAAPTIELRHVTFGYEPGRKVLNDLSVTLPAGGCYAVVGASGSGKSTLLSLVMGANALRQGTIALDGHDLAKASLKSLYRTVSLVRQNTFLFDATLRDNVTMFGSCSDEEVLHAIAQAGLDDFVKRNGLGYPCGESGSNLSGGERQRVCIARSLLHGSRVLLLDEATSALDQATADQVTRSVVGLQGTTRILVTHRLDAGQLRLFDGIIVLRDGRVCEKGTFDELMGLSNGYFHALYQVGQ